MLGYFVMIVVVVILMSTPKTMYWGQMFSMLLLILPNVNCCFFSLSSAYSASRCFESILVTSEGACKDVQHGTPCKIMLVR